MLMYANVTGLGLAQADMVTWRDTSINSLLKSFASAFHWCAPTITRLTLIADLTGGKGGGKDRGNDGAMQLRGKGEI